MHVTTIKFQPINRDSAQDMYKVHVQAAYSFLYMISYNKFDIQGDP